MTSPFTKADNLPLFLCHEGDRFACECDWCHAWRRARVLEKCREIESRLSRDAIVEQTRRDDEGWLVIITRAQLIDGVAPAANDNEAPTMPTMRPPSLPAMRAAGACHG